jgi:hypothetical protein
MGILDSLNDVLKSYSGGGAQNTTDAVAHFDQAAQAVPQNMIADGLAAVFRSNQTPDFGNLVSQLFSNSTGEQKAGILNHLLASGGPSVLTQLAGGGVLSELLGAASNGVTPDQAQTVSPELVQQLAAHAESKDPSIVDRASEFYAQHPTLIKTLGSAAMSIALARLAERQKAAA